MANITNFPKQGDDKKVSLRNSNFPQFNYEFAKNIKENFSDIWKKGGNIRGNEAFEYWGKARNGQETENILDWIKEREAWMARHEKNKLIAGVVAVMKWGGIVTRGEKYMKDLINKEKEKGGDGLNNKINKTFSSEIKQIGQEEDRILRFITSTEAEDRDGDIIEIDGWKLDNYMKNPVILFGHDYGSLPVGKSVNIQKDVVNKKLIQDIKFPTKDEYEFADTVYRLAKSGYLPATSVGFIGLESEPRLDEKGNYLGKIYKKQELLETSIVPVPSNPTALMEARSKGIINEEELKMLEEIKNIITKPGWDETGTSFRFRVREPGLFQEGTFRTVPIKEDKPRVNSVMGRLKGEETLTIQSLIFPKEDDWTLAKAKTWLDNHPDLTKGVDNMETKTVIPFKHYPLADEGAAWNGPREIREADVDDLKIMCAWYDRENPDIEASYKLPHHRQSDKHTVWRGVAASMAVLLGARGGVDVPEDEKRGIYNHLIKHYKEFDKEPPEFRNYSDIEIKEIFENETNEIDLSLKTREEIEKCIGNLQKGIEELNNILGNNSEKKEKLECSVKIEMSDEIKKEFENIKSEISLLSKKNNEDEINLDSIELPMAEKNAEQDELDIKPEELKELVKEILENELKGGK